MIESKKILKDIELLENKIDTIEKSLPEDNKEIWLRDLIKIQNMITPLKLFNGRTIKLKIAKIKEEIKWYEESLDLLLDPEWLEAVAEIDDAKDHPENYTFHSTIEELKKDIMGDEYVEPRKIHKFKKGFYLKKKNK
jgi:hypothetical protein